MKKFLSFVLIIAMVMPVPSVWAKTDTKMMEAVLLSVKERIQNTDSLKEFTSNESSNEDGFTLYHFNWNDGGKGEDYINVTASENGIIYFYSIPFADYYREKPSFSEISEETAYEKAKELAVKINPEISDEIFVEMDNSRNSLYSKGFSFSLQRYKNGIPVVGDTGRIELDEKAEKIVNYRIEFTENVPFENSDNTINAEEAKKAYAENLGLRLIYSPKREDNKIIPYLAYSHEGEYDKISAVDGNLIDTKILIEFYDNLREETAMDSMASGGSNKFSEAEVTEIEKIEGLLSKDEGLQIIKSNKYINLADDMQLTSYRVSKSYYGDEYTAGFRFQNDNGYISCTIDAVTGQVISFYRGGNDVASDTEEVLTKEEAEALANEAAASLSGEKFSEYKIKENDNGYFTYTRYVNDIPFEFDSISLNVNYYTGEIRSYNIGYTDVEFQKPDGIISIEDATDKLFEQAEFKMQYVFVNREEEKFVLVYDFEDYYISLDAVTGEKIGYNGEKEDKFAGYTDVSGHYAENQINTLAKYGIRVSGDKFTPDETITQGDFLKLIDALFYRGGEVLLKSGTGYDFRNLIINSIVDKEEIKEDKPLTRLEAAKILVRAIGGEEFAVLDGIYVCPFCDVTEGIGYVSILSGMKVINGDGSGMFNPNGVLTYADSAVIIYNYLAR